MTLYKRVKGQPAEKGVETIGERTASRPKKSGLDGLQKYIIPAVLILALGIGVIWSLAKRSHDETVAEQKSLYQQGAKEFSEGKFGMAAKSLEEAAKLNPGDAKVHLSLAKSYESMGKLDKAVTEYKRNVELDSKNPETHYSLAIIYRSRGKIDDAIAEFNKAISLRKDFVAAKLMLAQTLSGQGKNKEAIDQYRSVLGMKPFGADLAQIHVDLGIAYNKTGNHDQAVNEWRTALSLDEHNAQAQFLLEQ